MANRAALLEVVAARNVFASGHDFSRAVELPKQTALAAEVRCST
jgi:hypothetical protein